jgi:trk system potassium uptake protein TrkH
MKRFTIVRILAIINGGISLIMLPSLVTAIVMGEFSMVASFIIPMTIGLITAVPAILLIPKTQLGIRPRDGFLLVFLVWIFSTLLGSLCYYFAPAGMSWADAIFESACGFATTGATTISDVEALPLSLLLWRSTSQWAGGMGIILLFVALLPILGVGGFQLIKAEVPGPEKERVRPKINEAAKITWGVYCIFTLLLILLYRLGGMDWFDAVCHGFSILSTGGASTKNAGFGFYDSAFIDWVTVVFMLLGAMNFTLYYRIARGKYQDLFINSEARAFVLIFLVCAAAVSIIIIPSGGSASETLRDGFFQTASILSTTGNTRVDYSAWPALAQVILFCLMLIGGCSGSTAGGIKVIRHVVLFKQAVNELRRILYPRGVFSIQLNRKVGRKDVVYGVAGFVFLYSVITGFGAMITAASGVDVFSSICTSLSMISNIGVSFSAAGPINNFSDFPDYLKLYYSLVMIAGRLELWTVLVLFTPGYWKN